MDLICTVRSFAMLIAVFTISGMETVYGMPQSKSSDSNIAAPLKIVQLLWEANPEGAASTLVRTLETALDRKQAEDLAQHLEKLEPKARQVVESRKWDDPRMGAAIAVLVLSSERQETETLAPAELLTQLPSGEQRQLVLRVWMHSAQPEFMKFVAETLRTLPARDQAPDFPEPETDWLIALVRQAVKADPAEAAEMLLARWSRLPVDVQVAAIEPLSGSADGMSALITAVENDRLDKGLVNANQLRKWLRSDNAELKERIGQLWGQIRMDADRQRQELVSEMLEHLRSGVSGSPRRGQQVFDRVCSQCHVLHGRGHEVGPKITNNGRGSLEQLVSNVFDPSLVIGEAFQSKTVMTYDGDVVTGLVESETDNYVSLKIQGGQIREFHKEQDIDLMKDDRVSLMPEGVEEQMSDQELVDLFAYLSLVHPLDVTPNELIPGTPLDLIEEEFQAEAGRPSATTTSPAGAAEREITPPRNRERQSEQVGQDDAASPPPGRPTAMHSTTVQSAAEPHTDASSETTSRGGVAGDERLAKLNLEADWPWWRGPRRDGTAANTASTPVRFGANENIIWRTPIPGRGHSSPVVVGERVFLTSADEVRQIHLVLAYDLATGDLLWRRELNQGGFPENNHPKNTEASPTLASDGERLFATFFFHKTVTLTALDLDGEQRWQRVVTPFNPQRYEYGYAPSPVIYDDLVIVSAEQDGPSHVVAYQRSSGDEVWRTPRKPSISFSSPVVARVAGRDQLLISGQGQLRAYDPRSGEPLWGVDGTAAATCGTAVWHAGLVIASGGYPDKQTIAVHADGSGRVAWKNNRKCYEQSMLVADGLLHALTDDGILYCWHAATGRELWRERLSGPVSASPVFAGGLIYWGNERGTIYVFRPNPERFELVAENRLGDQLFASPAVTGDRMLWRVAELQGTERQEFLYLIGEAD